MAKVTTFNKKQLENEISRRAKKSFWIALIIFTVLGIYSALISVEYTCKHSVLKCRFSFGDYALAALLGALIYVVLVGLPLGYIEYQDTKWSLRGYKSINGVLTTIFSIWFVTTALYPDFFRWLDSVTFPNFTTIVGTLIFIVYVIWFIVSAVYYHSLKEQYEKDKKTGKLPKMAIIDVLKSEESSRVFIEKENQKNTARKAEIEKDDDYDDGL